MIEIERKFLITSSEFKTQSFKNTRIIQGYLNSNPERTVRVRVKGDKGFLTIKGLGNESGATRFELEKEISIPEAMALFNLCEKGTIDKIRYEIKVGNHIYEVDEFLGENSGLYIAEIELSQENEPFIKPEWLGQEVTKDSRYYNAYISQNPYTNWKIRD